MKKISLLIYLILCAFPLSAEFTYNLAVCAVFRDEAPYLKEWIDFHRIVGVEHFYLCSHNSCDDYKVVLEPYIKAGIVDLVELQGDPNESVALFNINVQCMFYNTCVNHLKGVARWVAFIDSDEFLFPSAGKGLLTDVLKDYEGFGGVAVNWQMYGTSSIEQIEPGKLITKYLIRKAKINYFENLHVKSIVQPLTVTHFDNPHFANYIDGFFQVTTDFTPFKGPKSPFVQIDTLRINHYWTRDENYLWNVKAVRQSKWWGENRTNLENRKREMNKIKDCSIYPYLAALKRNSN